ncbi:hypothetical protein NDU88_000817 [Pleurodeles waltl]|uniref:Uncharacterized protein n=1 Tax=Pleurodeles waltl TaxID=8319 RepID=A0AAV7P3L3_PLEWA|nr:hypothetical protein NDU88_000817 [Pleurodeles waltl]
MDKLLIKQARLISADLDAQAVRKLGHGSLALMLYEPGSLTSYLSLPLNPTMKQQLMGLRLGLVPLKSYCNGQRNLDETDREWRLCAKGEKSLTHVLCICEELILLRKFWL